MNDEGIGGHVSMVAYVTPERAELNRKNERNNEFNLFSILKNTFVVFIWLGYFFIAIAFVMSYVD